MLSAPTSTAPAASSRSISVASRGGGVSSRLIFDPARVGRPCTSNRFFTANGTPASGPGFLPAAMAASTARALSRARSAVTSVKEFRSRIVPGDPRQRGLGSAQAPTFPAADSLRDFEADIPSPARCHGVSGCKDTGRLGFVGQREFIDQPRQPQRHFEIGPHRGLPGCPRPAAPGAFATASI